MGSLPAENWRLGADREDLDLGGIVMPYNRVGCGKRSILSRIIIIQVKINVFIYE